MKKTARIDICCTPEDKKELRRRADMLGMRPGNLAYLYLKAGMKQKLLRVMNEGGR